MTDTAQLALLDANPPPLNYGWFGTIEQFLQTPIANWLEILKSNYQALYQQRATTTQQQAWQDCGEILRQQLTQLIEQRSESAAWTLIFEYELPQEGGRRPDLVLLAAGQILVFEFKQKQKPSTADLDQVTAYARDLAEYHRASHSHPVTPILVPTRCRLPQPQINSSVQVVPPLVLAEYLAQIANLPEPIDPLAWVQSVYAPLPTVIQAARSIFQQEPLPDIKRARSANIPQLLDYLYQLVETAQTQQERHLVLITGVPGAGKTLVGLQFVYQHPASYSADANAQAALRQAVFLSGNGPLITVLQYALKSRVFVQAVRNFYLQYEVRQQAAPSEHIIVFDEAQRAWDAERMAEKYGIERAAAGAVLGIAERVKDWCVVVGLIGEGQEIHVGEEEGLEQWHEGLSQTQTAWHLHCAPEQTASFPTVPEQRLHTRPLFNLTTSLRSHLAIHVQTWVAHLLAGDFTAAAQLMPDLQQSGFDAYLTRNLEAAKAYCRERYQNQPQKRYGLIASSRARNLAAHGIPNDYYATSRLNVGAWYIDPPDSPASCCALERAVTEFGCQGLELDFPLIGWGDDLRWQPDPHFDQGSDQVDQQAGTWTSSTRQRNVRNPLQLRLNSYRVLLTRGRDGLVVFVPPEAKMDSTYAVLQAAGLEPFT